MTAWASTADHPVLQMQQSINSGGRLNPISGIASDAIGVIDSTPAIVAGFVLGATITLVTLKAAGFRFNFGVGAKVGK